MRVLRSAVLAACALLLLSFPLPAATSRVAVDIGWIKAVRVQRGWLVTWAGRMVTAGAAQNDPWYSWKPPLLSGDIITEIGHRSAMQMSPLTVAALLSRALWRPTTVRVERDGRQLALELNRKFASAETASDRPVKELGLADPAPDFSLPDMSGTVVRSTDLRGQWVLLNFWGTWCSGCYAEFPALSDLAHRGGDRLAVLGVAVNDQRETVQKFLLKNHLRYPVLLGGRMDEDMARSFNVSACPTNVVIAPDGTVRFSGVGPQSLETAARIVVSGLTTERPQP